ncbi:MAG TPA: hypothetical protein VFF31_04375, partial [Blastocatellia bacterium]|nr:hypothetical protein [Blastocatellia bacterium]
GFWFVVSGLWFLARRIFWFLIFYQYVWPNKPETTNRKPETTNQKPETRNDKPETTNHKPETINQKRKARNDKPEIRNFDFTNLRA